MSMSSRMDQSDPVAGKKWRRREKEREREKEKEKEERKRKQQRSRESCKLWVTLKMITRLFTSFHCGERERENSSTICSMRKGQRG